MYLSPAEWFLSLSIFTQAFLIYLLVINIITFFFFGVDKAAASMGHKRTPEKKLWTLTFIGGSIGALLGMEFFHHKRRKVGFYSIVILFFLIHLSLTVLFVQ